MANFAAYGRKGQLSGARAVRAAGWEPLWRIARWLPIATCRTELVSHYIRHGVRLLIYGGLIIRIATAAAVALTVTMCSYWAQSSVHPTAPLTEVHAARQQTTAKTDRLDAYVREERAAGALVDPPGRADVLASLPWPLAGRISTGMHVGPHGERAYGIRISLPVGTPVRAAADGIVVFAGNASDGYGKKVVIKHGAIRSVYAHLGKILVSPKATVRKGQIIAKSGQSGIATSPRLHLGLVGAGPSIDPIKFFGRTGEQN